MCKLIHDFASTGVTSYCLIKIKNVQKSFDNLHVIGGISENIFPGEIISLVGPSGCGKSTLLRLIAGAETIDSGSIKCLVPPEKIGFIFQDVRLLPWQTAMGNIMFVLKNRITETKEREAHAMSALQKVGLADFADYLPKNLSGGMRKRVAIARALAIEADLFLFDEPFSDLDLPLRMLLIQEIQKILKDGNKTAIYVTHDIREALSLSDRVLILSSRPALVKEVITLTGENRINGVLSPELLAIEEKVIISLKEETRYLQAVNNHTSKAV